MTDSLSQNINSKLKFLGLYQLIGGAIGVLLVVWGLLKAQQFSGLILGLYLFIALFFGFSIYCGTLCLRARPNSLSTSLVNQILQVIGLALFGLTFKYVAGLYFTAGLNLTEDFNLTFGAGISKFDFNFNNENERLELDFNFIALGLIVFIERLKKSMKEEKDKKDVASLGQT